MQERLFIILSCDGWISVVGGHHRLLNNRVWYLRFASCNKRRHKTKHKTVLFDAICNLHHGASIFLDTSGSILSCISIIIMHLCNSSSHHMQRHGCQFTSLPTEERLARPRNGSTHSMADQNLPRIILPRHGPILLRQSHSTDRQTTPIVHTRIIVETATIAHFHTKIVASSSGINVSRTKDGGDYPTDTKRYGRE